MYPNSYLKYNVARHVSEQKGNPNLWNVSSNPKESYDPFFPDRIQLQ